MGGYVSEELSLPTPSYSEEESQTTKTLYKAKKRPEVSLRVPNRHRSLIGRSEERVQLMKSLELSRLPCNLQEIRQCRKMLKICYEISDLAVAYTDPFNTRRRCLRDFLNKVLKIPIRRILDLKTYPYEGYSPNLPVWLYRRVIKSLHLGNGISQLQLFLSKPNC